MKFLGKRPLTSSDAAEWVYKAKGDNSALRERLIADQCGYCAYTERRLDTHVDTVAVEHFDPRLKNTPDDGYLNHYAVLQTANQRKRRRERQVQAEGFFERAFFFQAPGGFEARIRYVPGEFVYEERSLDDHEAERLIRYLDLNHPRLVRLRREAVRRLRSLFNDADYGAEQMREHFRTYPSELHYPTVLEAELGLADLVTAPR